MTPVTASASQAATLDWNDLNARGPGLTMLAGDRVLVSPTAKPELPEDIWQALLLVQDADCPDPAAVEAVISAAETHMGTTEFHRIQALQTAGLISTEEAEARRALVRRKVMSERLWRKMTEARRATQLNTPLRASRLSDEVTEKLRQAEERRAIAADLRSKLPPKGRSRAALKAIKDHEGAAKLYEREASDLRSRETNENWRRRATQESEDLAKNRGEAVVYEDIDIPTFVLDEHGARVYHKQGEMKGLPVIVIERAMRTVIESRGGGLEQALTKGYLDGGRGAPKAEVLVETGARYREAYEISEALISSEGGGSGGFGPKGPQLRLVAAGEALAVMRRGLSARERTLLDLVCGQERRVRLIATQVGLGFPALCRTLRNGLRIAGENLKAAKKDRKDGTREDPVERVRGAHAMLAKVR